MNEIELIQEMAATARRCSSPRVNAVSGVLAEIRQRQPVSLATLGWATTFASAAAMVALSLFGFEVWQVVNDPLSELMTFTNLVNS